MAFLLYAAGSPLIVEYEEAIRSQNGSLIAIAMNTQDESLASDQGKLVPADSLERANFETAEILVPLFTPGHRHSVALEITARATQNGTSPTFGTLAHSSAIIADSAVVSAGSFINAGVTIGAEARISEHCIVNRSASLGHHVELGAYVSIGPGVTLAGQIRVGRGTVIGAGSVVLPGTEIGENSVVAAGSVVSRKSVPSNVVVSGNPARVIGRPITGYGKTSVPPIERDE